MKKFFSILLAVLMIFALAACGSSSNAPAAGSEDEGEGEATAEAVNVKVGMVCIGNENMAYDRNFYMAADAAKEVLAKEGINVEWLYTYDHPAGDPVAADCEELAEAGCAAVFLNSYGMEPAMLTVAADYPDVIFAALTNETSKSDDLDNTINAFPNIYEGRYLAGVAAGCKLQDMIDSGVLKPEEAVIGYVGAYTYSEVLSGYTAFFLGARSVCPSVTMQVEFIGSWGDPTIEAATAQDLIDKGCKLISQHSDATTPATTADAAGVFHVGYNIDMSDVAPNASIISSRIDWTNYFVYVIRCVVAGEQPDQDYMGHGLADGDVKLTKLNNTIAAPGTKEAIEAAQAKIISGELQIFDTSTYTVGGETVTSDLVDMNADFTPDEGYDAVFDGAYHESYFKSAPAFSEQIDGITLLNVAF